MRSLNQSFIIVVLFVWTSFTYADRRAQRYDITHSNHYQPSEHAPATVTASTNGHNNPAEGAWIPHWDTSAVPVTPNSGLSDYKSCFDRDHHPYTYSFGQGGFHFRGGSKGGFAGATAPWPGKPSSHITKSFSSLPTSKTSSMAHTSPNNTSTGQHTSTTPAISYSSTTLTTSQSTSTSSNLPTNTTVPDCQLELQLVGVLEYGFNKKNVAFSVRIANCSKFDVANTTAFANFAAIDGMTVTSDSILLPGFTSDYVLLSILALDTSGRAIIKSYQLHFGSVDMPILVLGPDNQPAIGALVYGNATTYPGVSQECTTDASGQCSLTDLPLTTIGLVAKADNNSIAVNGLAATSGQVTLQLLPFTQPTGNSTFDVNNGTSGWTGGVVTQSLKIKRDTVLSLSTNGQYGLQRTNNSFPVHPFTKTAYIKYKFITSEVPGGYFGTQFNDYYSVTIRSNTGAFVTVTNSMNALGLGAFDANGATEWFTLSLSVPLNTKSVEYDIAVSNVADNLYDSSIIVDKVGDLQCDDCGDCSSCPSDPMCQSSCTDPPYKSCDFYRNCAEGQLGCGADGYPLGFGEKNCNKFTNNLNYFSSAGQDWIFSTMHCLQTAMVPVLQPCSATCSSFQTAAFASHPGCYVDNGFCGLQCPDVVAVLFTVGQDLITMESLKQVVKTSGLCLENLLQTLTGCTGEIVFGAATGTLSAVAAKVAVAVALSFFNSVE